MWVVQDTKNLIQVVKTQQKKEEEEGRSAEEAGTSFTVSAAVPSVTVRAASAVDTHADRGAPHCNGAQTALSVGTEDDIIFEPYLTVPSLLCTGVTPVSATIPTMKSQESIAAPMSHVQDGRSQSPAQYASKSRSPQRQQMQPPAVPGTTNRINMTHAPLGPPARKFSPEQLKQVDMAINKAEQHILMNPVNPHVALPCPTSPPSERSGLDNSGSQSPVRPRNLDFSPARVLEPGQIELPSRSTSDNMSSQGSFTRLDSIE